MMPCCQRTYCEYLDKDGKLDLEAWAQIRLELQEVKPKKKKRSLFNHWKWAVKLFPEVPPDGLCECKCHRVGNQILH